MRSNRSASMRTYSSFATSSTVTYKVITDLPELEDIRAWYVFVVDGLDHLRQLEVLFFDFAGEVHACGPGRVSARIGGGKDAGTST